MTECKLSKITGNWAQKLFSNTFFFLTRVISKVWSKQQNYIHCATRYLYSSASSWCHSSPCALVKKKDNAAKGTVIHLFMSSLCHFMFYFYCFILCVYCYMDGTVIHLIMSSLSHFMCFMLHGTVIHLFMTCHLQVILCVSCYMAL